MFITCPDCSTKFVVADDAIPDAGRKLRCGSCSHVWHQEPMPPEVKEEIEEVKKEQEENLAKAKKEEDSGRKPALPVVYEPKPAPKFFKIAVMLLVGLNIAGFLTFYKDKIGHTEFYDMIGQFESEGVVIEKVVMLDPYISKDGITHYIDWIIKNNSEEKREIPYAKISMLDASEKVIESTQSQHDGKLEPGKEYRFKANKIEDKGKKARYLIIEIGNYAEIARR